MKNDDHEYYLELIRNLRDNGFKPDEVATGLNALENRIIASRSSTNKKYHPIDHDRFFRSIVDGSAIGVAVFEKDEAIYVNATLLRLFELDPADDKLDYTKFFCDHASPRSLSIMHERDKVMEQGFDNLDPFIAEFTLDTGRKILFETHSRPVYTQSGFWRICYMIDVTEKLASRFEIDQKIHRYESILSGTDAGTWEWNLKTLQGQYNDKWAEMLGYEPAELTALAKGRTWEYVICPEDKAMSDRIALDLIYGKIAIMQFDARLVHKKGHLVWVHSRGRITDWDEHGNPTVLSGAVIDITDKMVAEEKLLKANEQLERSVNALSIVSQAKEDFLSTMSHEIRTPLNAVIGLSNLLLRRSPRPDQLEIVRTLKNSSDNLLHLVNDILDYNKIQAGKLQLESVRFDFREFVEHLYSTFKLDAQDRGLDLQVTADPQIPETLGGDVTRLNQILINLLSNALKFTKEGQVSLDISLVSIEDGVCIIRFIVTDTGIGVHPSKLNKIFEPFHQSDASINRRYGGTGLGLSIVKALVKMFDGTIIASSLPGKGSSFAVQLKLREGSVMPIDSWSGTWELPFSHRQVRVLYVEDVESNRFLVKTLMEEFKLTCIIADTGKEALQKTLQEKFDVILMDIQMPGMDGYQAAQAILTQEEGKNIKTPIVAFTAEPITDTLRLKLAQHNMRDVISKPFDIDQFMEKIAYLSSAEGSDERDYSFAFYNRPTVGNITKHIRTIVADEIEMFTAALTQSYQKNDLDGMHAEMHKLHPIIKNLKMISVSMSLDQLRSFDRIDPMMVDIINSIKERIDSVVLDLRNKQGAEVQ